MIAPKRFLDALESVDIRFVTGVPDSLLKHICALFTAGYPANRHIIATNEGSAVGLAIGHYLATSRPALVYMQNSGLGNVVNPVTSLADPQVYAVPMVLMIGWRGEVLGDGTQLKDEPQHKKQGRITLAKLQTLDIPHRVMDQHTVALEDLLKELVETALARSGPVALVVRKNTFASCAVNSSEQNDILPTREEAIRAILASLPQDVPVVSTTGMASREVFELRRQFGQGHQRDFLTVGGMGHAGQIAAGIAMANPLRKVVCIDGDGAVLMHMGALAISADCDNLIHILINNQAHDSVGGQPTKGAVLDFSSIANTLGYRRTTRVADLAGLRASLASSPAFAGSVFLEVMCKRGARKDLGRPDRTPLQNKTDFMQFLQEVDA